MNTTDQTKDMTGFACYRLPEEHHYTYMAQTEGVLERVGSVRDLGVREGFVMAPFVASDRHPLLLLRPDVVERHETGPWEGRPAGWLAPSEPCAVEPSYAAAFARFHREISAGRFGKLVLSRRVHADLPSPMDAMLMFQHACQLYPHQFVALVSMPPAGTWLMATPEVLLEGSGSRWHTMALAGTMKAVPGPRPALRDDWSEKNLSEQHYVSSYIADILRQYACEVTSAGPYTTMAAHLLHLRTDFNFSLIDEGCLGSLLHALHPTPAVCGMPKEEARAFILAYEGMDRRYYSGFCGPLSACGETHLYVSLRCMEILPHAVELYAGGGILPHSTIESEWGETQAKLQTMLRLIT